MRGRGRWLSRRWCGAAGRRTPVALHGTRQAIGLRREPRCGAYWASPFSPLPAGGRGGCGRTTGRQNGASRAYIGQAGGFGYITGLVHGQPWLVEGHAVDRGSRLGRAGGRREAEACNSFDC